MTVHDDAGVTLANWQDGPWNRWSFQHVSAILPTDRIRAQESAVMRLERRVGADLGAIELLRDDGSVVALEQHLASSFTDGIAVLHEGAIVYERYFDGMQGDSLHLSMSVMKSFAGLLVGVMAARGLIEPERPITDYLPELSRSGFAGATVQQLLNMTASTSYWDDGPGSELVKLDIASGWRPPDGTHAPIGVLEFGATVGPGPSPHGDSFRYASLNTDLVALTVQRAGQARFSELFSELLWKPLGAASDAEITLDPTGAVIASGGFSATLLDYARVGQLVVQDGVVHGHPVVSATWLASSQRVDGVPATTATGVASTYWSYWWRVAGRTCGLGIHGQVLAIDPAARVVIAMLSSWPKPEDEELRRSQWKAVDAIVTALRR